MDATRRDLLKTLAGLVSGLMIPEDHLPENSVGAYKFAEIQKRTETYIDKNGKEAERPYRYVLGAVLVPNVVDLQKDWASPEDIEDACHDFMSVLTVGDSHTRVVKSDAAIFVENYVMPVDATIGNVHIAKGTWMVGARVYDPAMIEKIDTGKYNGFSIGGHAEHIEEKLIAD